MKKGKAPAAQPEPSRLVERDLTGLARDKRLGRAHGVDSAVEEICALLARGERAVLLAGESGVGKSALAAEAAHRIAEGRVPAALLEARMLEVPMAGLWSRARDPRHAAELLEGLFQELAAHPKPTVLFIRDGSGVGGLLVPVLVAALRARKVRVIIEASLRTASILMRLDQDFVQCLHYFFVDEPSDEVARAVLARVAEDLAGVLDVAIDASACEQALRLSKRFLVAQQLPGKAIALIEGAAAAGAAAGREAISGADVLQRFCALTRLPRFVVDDEVPLDIAETERFFADRILGQPEAVATVLRPLALLKAGLNDARRPLGVFLFPGPTGVGKTHLAKLLAEYLFGAGDRLVRVNMADFAEDGSETVLFGNPWHGERDVKRGLLTRLLEDKVFAVLLLDEFEKACRGLHDRFLQLFDEGRFINANDETVLCSNLLIVATSNAGAEVYREPPIGFGAEPPPEKLVAEVDRRIAQAFRAEFLNRFDALCHFRPLGRVEIRRIAQREVGRVLLRDGIRQRGLEVEVQPDVVDLLVERGYSPLFGARFLQREIEKTLTNALAVEIARRPLATGTRVVVERRGGRVVAQAVEARVEAPSAQVQIAQAGVHAQRRRLETDELLAAANDLVHRAEALAAQSGQPALRERREELLARATAPTFWDDPEAAARALREFRAVEERLAALDAIGKLCRSAQGRLRSAKGEVQLQRAARLLEDAAQELSLHEARARAGHADADEVLLEICASGDGELHDGWVRELCRMYLAWAERRAIEARAVAEAREPARCVLHLAGPGVRGLLFGEAGLHRRIGEDGRAAATVRLHAAPAPAEGDLSGRARELKRKAGAFVAKVSAEARAQDDLSGRALALEGDLPPAQLCALAGALLAAEGQRAAEARRYHVGRAARVEDPRTGAGTPRLKDVLRGELDLFISAFLSRPPEARPEP